MKSILTAAGLSNLVTALQTGGFTVLGPVRQDGVIQYRPLASADDLPVGWADEQHPGHYRTVPRSDQARFGYAVGPASWKQFLFPAQHRMFSMQGDKLEPGPGPRPLALFGVRACELAAIRIQDRVFVGKDAQYTAQRQQVFIVAVNCSVAAPTCFCTSMGSGPEITAPYDLSLTEIDVGESYRALVEAGSPAGRDILAQVPHAAAGPEDLARAGHVVEACRQQMGTPKDRRDGRELLYRNREHPRWEETAKRCLTCTNCTMVCPTCFCTSVTDATDLEGTASRTRSWDSCFSLAFSYVHGGSVRPSAAARYRHWLTHKFAAWHDQFDTPGCVGCGRCATWCPVGIDVREELDALEEAPHDALS